MQTSNFTELPALASHSSLQQLAREHSLYERRLETLRSKMLLTGPEQLEELRLKKLKLSIKDEMERLRRAGDVKEATSFSLSSVPLNGTVRTDGEHSSGELVLPL